MWCRWRMATRNASPSAITPPSRKPANSVEIQINRIRLPRSMQALSLDPAKLEKAIGGRRSADGYSLTDGLFSLRAAEALGLERISAIIE